MSIQEENLTIQQKIERVNERSRSMEFALLFGFVALVCLGYFFTRALAMVLVILAAYLAVSFWVQPSLRKWRKTRILELYHFQAKPIFEIQYTPNDKYVYLRAMEHRQMLTESGNQIWKRGIISVEEYYYEDAIFGYGETPETRAEKRDLHIKEFLNKWLTSQSQENIRFVKQWIYRQEMEDETPTPVVETTPSVVEAKTTGNFWSWPILSGLIRRNKEVVSGS